MQIAVFNDKKIESGCCSDGQLIQIIIQYLPHFLGERDVTRHPYQAPPSAFETSDIYYSVPRGLSDG